MSWPSRPARWPETPFGRVLPEWGPFRLHSRLRSAESGVVGNTTVESSVDSQRDFPWADVVTYFGSESPPPFTFLDMPAVAPAPFVVRCRGWFRRHLSL